MKALREPLWWLIALFIGLLAGLPYSAPLFSRLFPELPRPVYQQESFWALTLDHGWLVVVSSLAATAVGLGAGVAVTRPAGSAFRPLVETIAAIGQTFPPVAVLALAVPMMGFGAAPTFLALTLYGLLPIFENSLAALSNLPAPVVEAARGMGMTEGQVLRQVELPLALPLIIAGVRLTTVISLSTAAIGSTVAAKSLGEVIIAGLLSDNAAFILQGGFIIAGLAVLIHELLSWAETRSRHA